MSKTVAYNYLNIKISIQVNMITSLLEQKGTELLILLPSSDSQEYGHTVSEEIKRTISDFPMNH